MAAARSTLVSLDHHVDSLGEAVDRFRSAATMSWMGATVPTCPGWRLLDLLAHLGMVHRWARAAVQGDRDTMRNATLFELEGRSADEPLRWLIEGARNLRDALAAAPDDLKAPVFLAQAPPARFFWARRVCHETVIHALDAVAAQQERMPRAEDAWFSRELALDGVDELLIGFWGRAHHGPRAQEPYAVLIRPSDAGIAWLLEVGPDRACARRLAPGEAPHADAQLAGSSVDLYLALWNRGGEVADDDGLLPRWRPEGAVSWK